MATYVVLFDWTERGIKGGRSRPADTSLRHLPAGAPHPGSSASQKRNLPAGEPWSGIRTPLLTVRRRVRRRLQSPAGGRDAVATSSPVRFRAGSAGFVDRLWGK